MWLERRDPPSRPVMFGWLVAIQLVGMSVPVLGATTYFPLDTHFVLGLVAFFGAIGASTLLYSERARVGWLVGVWLLAFPVFMLSGPAVAASVLGARGVTIEATVIADRKELGKGRDRVLTLADEDGRKLPNHVQVHEGYPVGGKIAVVVDPEGLFHPSTVEDLDEDGEATPWTWTFLLPFLAGLFALDWFASKPLPPVPSYPTPQPPPPPPGRSRRRRGRRKKRSQ